MLSIAPFFFFFFFSEEEEGGGELNRGGACRNGSDARGYFVWSFLDVFEFLFAYRLRFDLCVPRAGTPASSAAASSGRRRRLFPPGGRTPLREESSSKILWKGRQGGHSRRVENKKIRVAARTTSDDDVSGATRWVGTVLTTRA